MLSKIIFLYKKIEKYFLKNQTLIKKMSKLNKQLSFGERIINLPLELKREILSFLVDVFTSKWGLCGIVSDSGKIVYWTNKPIKIYHQQIMILRLNGKRLVNCLENCIGYIELKSIRNLTPPIYHFFIIKNCYVDYTCCKCKNKERSYDCYVYAKGSVKCDYCLCESSCIQCCAKPEILYIGQKIDYAIYQLLVENCSKSTCSCASTYSDILMRKILLEDIKKKFIL